MLLCSGPGFVVSASYRRGTGTGRILCLLYLIARPMIDNSETPRYFCTSAAEKGSTQTGLRFLWLVCFQGVQVEAEGLRVFQMQRHV